MARAGTDGALLEALEVHVLVESIHTAYLTHLFFGCSRSAPEDRATCVICLLLDCAAGDLAPFSAEIHKSRGQGGPPAVEERLHPSVWLRSWQRRRWPSFGAVRLPPLVAPLAAAYLRPQFCFFETSLSVRANTFFFGRLSLEIWEIESL